MTRISATASLGMKLGLGNKKGFTQYDSVSPHHSITIERTLSDAHTDEELLVKAEELHQHARKLVEKKINADIIEARKSE